MEPTRLHSLMGPVREFLRDQFQVIIPVFHSEKPLAFLLLASNLDSENETSYFSFVQTLTNIIAVAIENKRLGEQHIIKEMEA